MVLKTRSQIIMSTDTVQLKAQVRDIAGDPVDLDAFPTVSINQPSGNVAVGPTSAGVIRLDVGLYAFNYAVGCNPAIGVYSDIWDGFLNGIPIRMESNFIVHNTQMPFVNTDGYIALGDDPGFNYSQNAIMNINLLLKSLRARLDSRGKSKFKDEFGNDVYVDCDVFSPEQLTSFLAISLSSFNQIPHDTYFTFEDTDAIAHWHEILVQGATLIALSSKSLLERGREFQLSDNGIQFTPPTVSDLMQTQWSAELGNHWEKIQYIKKNLKPSPSGLGTLTIATSRHPAIMRERHKRARVLF